MNKRDAGGIAAIVATWCATIASIDPRGDFPLHDDWGYIVAAFNYVRLGHFHFPPVTVASVRAQVLWGALWAHLFGVNCNVLRASVLFLSLATLIVINRILARAGAPLWLCVFAPLALLFHPVFLWCACTFMTDVPYIFASCLSLYFFARGLREERMSFVVAGCMATAVSWFIRQNGVVNLLPPLALLVVGRPRRWRAFSAVIVAAGVAFVLMFFLKPGWLSGSPDMMALHYHVWEESSFRLPEQIATLFHYVTFTAINCAIFFLPLTVPLIAMRRRSRPALLLLAAIAALFVYRMTYLAWNGYLVPYTSDHLFSDILPGQVFFDFGVGPANLVDVFALHYPFPYTMPHLARVLLTIAAALLSTLLVWALAIGSPTGRTGNLACPGQAGPGQAGPGQAGPGQAGLPVLQLAVGSIVFGTLILFASGYYYDRYALDAAWAVAIALPLIVPWQHRLARMTAIASLIALGIFSTLAVQEQFAWQRARWQAFNDLRAQGIAERQIDGGAEARAFFELREASIRESRRPGPPRPYAIAFHPLPGFRVVARYPWKGYFGWHRGEIFALQRSE